MSQQQANQQEADDFGNRPSQELTAMSVRATEGGRNDELGPGSIQVQPNSQMSECLVKELSSLKKKAERAAAPHVLSPSPISKTVDEA
jgi:hypothetical protein